MLSVAYEKKMLIYLFMIWWNACGNCLEAPVVFIFDGFSIGFFVSTTILFEIHLYYQNGRQAPQAVTLLDTNIKSEMTNE